MTPNFTEKTNFIWKAAGDLLRGVLLGSKKEPDKLSKEAIAQYMTAELESLTQRAMQYENIFSNKVNFYLVIVTATIGGLILGSDIDAVREIYLPLVVVVLLLLFVMGWTTFVQGLDLSASSTFMYRRMGRIRLWFLDQEEDLFPYLPFFPGDNRPHYYAYYAPLRSLEAILLLVNAVLASAFVAGLWLFFANQVFSIQFRYSETVYWIALVIAILAFVATWIIELKYAKYFMDMKEAGELGEVAVHFPAEELKKRFTKQNKDN